MIGVFHELGHLVLYRDHRNDQYGGTFCLSIIRASQAFCRDSYNENTPEAFLDELFDTRFFNEVKNRETIIIDGS